MGVTIHLAIGILGNAASLLLYAAPLFTFRRVIRKGSTEEFSCVPYIVALFNCLLYTWYSLPVVSSGWENLPVCTINGLGILLEISFIGIYLRFAPREQRKFAILMVTPMVVLFGSIAVLSSFALHHQHQRQRVVGTIGVVASISMYSSPLVAARQVIKTKSVEFMPLHLSLFSLLASSLWMAYGLIGRDLFIAAPNFIGCPIGVSQLALYCTYRRSKEASGLHLHDSLISKNIISYNEEQVA